MNIRTEYRCCDCKGEFPKADETLRNLPGRRICAECFDRLLDRPDLTKSQDAQLRAAGRIEESFWGEVRSGMNPDRGYRFRSEESKEAYIRNAFRELHREGEHEGDFEEECPDCKGSIANGR